MPDRLRRLWDFDDLPASDERLRAALGEEPDPIGKAELLTQLARLEGLRNHFSAGAELLDEAETLAGGVPVVDIRLRLERGRLLRSGGETPAALPHFVAAYQLALAERQDFLAADAAHMAALAAGSREGFLSWTERGMAVAVAAVDPEDSYWAGPLLNNLGWEYLDAGEAEPALAAFQQALAERLKYPENQAAVRAAREAVAEALKALGRNGEAIAVPAESQRDLAD